MNNTEIIAEEIIKIAYDKGGLINADDLTEDQRKATTDNAVDYVMRFYGTFSGDGKNRYYGLNEKGFELGRRGFFSGEEKERKRQRTGVNIAIITSIASAIIAILDVNKPTDNFTPNNIKFAIIPTIPAR